MDSQQSEAITVMMRSNGGIPLAISLGCRLISREPGYDDEPEWFPIRLTRTQAVWAFSAVPPVESPLKRAP